MDFPQIYIDILRAAHLIFLAAGMGTGLFFDFRSFRTLKDPVTPADILDFEQIHLWITCAFIGLWITGLALIYVRTGFDPAAFSPKLWMKVGVMVFMTWNARRIARSVLPLMKANVSRPMISLPKLKLMAATQIGVNSLFSWTTGLLLGSSVVLKTAPWAVLVAIVLVLFVVFTVAGHLAVTLLRMSVAVRSGKRTVGLGEMQQNSVR